MEEPMELTGVDAERWKATKAAASDLADAITSGDAEGAEAAMNALAQVPLNLEAVLDSVHVPEDAGEYAEGLKKVMRRIPPGWGRWISTDKGWYALIVRLDEQLAALAPDYEVHQVKEKFGSLRYYFGLPSLVPECCRQLEVDDPRPYPGQIDPRWAPKDRTPDQQAELEAWLDRSVAHVESEECIAAHAALEPVRQARRALMDQMLALADVAEEESARTCEVCSAPARTQVRNYWYKTLCDSCGSERGYTDFDPED